MDTKAVNPFTGESSEQPSVEEATAKSVKDAEDIKEKEIKEKLDKITAVLKTRMNRRDIPSTIVQIRGIIWGS